MRYLFLSLLLLCSFAAQSTIVQITAIEPRGAPAANFLNCLDVSVGKFMHSKDILRVHCGPNDVNNQYLISHGMSSGQRIANITKSGWQRTYQLVISFSIVGQDCPFNTSVNPKTGECSRPNSCSRVKGQTGDFSWNSTVWGGRRPSKTFCSMRGDGCVAKFTNGGICSPALLPNNDCIAKYRVTDFPCYPFPGKPFCKDETCTALIPDPDVDGPDKPDPDKPDPDKPDPDKPDPDKPETDGTVATAVNKLNSDVNKALDELQADINANNSDLQRQIDSLNGSLMASVDAVNNQLNNDVLMHDETKQLLEQTNDNINQFGKDVKQVSEDVKQASSDITGSINRNTNAVNGVSFEVGKVAGAVNAINGKVGQLTNEVKKITNVDTSNAGVSGTCIESQTCKSFIDSAYPDGLSGLMTKQLAALKTGTVDKFVSSFGNLDLSGAKRPSFSIPVPFYGDFSFETHMNFDWVFGFVRFCMVMTSIFTARRIIFGG